MSFAPSLSALGFDERWAALFAAVPGEPEALRVVRDDRGAIVASDGQREHRLDTPAGLRPVAGDWIAVADGVIVEIVERFSAVVRPRHDGEPQVLAANIDLVGIVHGLDLPLNPRRLERGLVLAWESGAQPVVVLTKADVAPEAAQVARDAEATAAGVEVLVVSTVDGRGLDDVRRLLAPNRTMALIGTSGAGKSSLVNALLHTDAMATGEVRQGDRKGRHTTSHRQLLAVPGGGVLLDTPGLRALAVGAAGEGVDKAFPEIETLSAGCRFGDCRHEQEPGCAVLAALDSGELAADRFEGWRRVRHEADSAALRADPAALRQRDRQWGRAAREVMKLKHGRKPRPPPDGGEQGG